MKKPTMKRLFAMLLAVVMLVGIMPMTTAAKQNLITAYFSTGKIETPAAPYIVDETDGGDTSLTIYFEQPSDLQQLALDAQRVGESALLADTYNLAMFTKFLQIDAKFNDGPWLSTKGNWDKVNEFNEQDYGVDPRDYCFLLESKENADNADKLISFTQSWLSYYDPAEPVNDFYVPFVKTKLNEFNAPVYYFDFSETTVTYRIRWCLRYIEDQYTDDERWTVVTSDWSPEVSIGKNGNQQPLTMPSPLDAPVLSDFSFVVEDGFSDTKCFVEIPDSVYAAEKYLLAMENAFEPFILDFQVKINDGDWQQGNTANATWLTNGYRLVGIDEIMAPLKPTDDLWVRLRIRSSSDEGGLSTPWSNVVGTKPLVTEKEDITLNVTVDGGGGKVTFDGETFYDNYSGTYAPDADPTVIFAPDDGYELDKVSVNGVETGVLGNVLTVLMDDNKDVVATFKKLPTQIILPLEKIVAKGGDLEPHAQQFIFELFGFGAGDMTETDLNITGNRISTNGAGTYTKDLVITADEEMFGNLTEGFYLQEKQATVDGWTYSDVVYAVLYWQEDDTSDPVWLIFPTAKHEIDNEVFYERLGDPVEKASFTNTYTKSKGEDDPTLFTLTYETNGGTAYPAEAYAPDTVVVLDKTPIREGYEFTGWYAENGAITKLDTVKMDADKTVYAGWKFEGELNTKDHVAYVKGYPNGTVGPNRNITRAETAAMLYRLLTPGRSAEITTTENSFTDVLASEWYNTEVSSMAKGGYIEGYADGSFDGDKSITRAEFVTIMVRFINPAPGTKTFTDVPATHWAHANTATATAASWIDGYEDGSFGPDNPITRAEAMTIINRVLNRGVDKDSELLDFKKWPDNSPTDWFYYDIIEASNTHEYVGSRPSEDWTKIMK